MSVSVMRKKWLLSLLGTVLVSGTALGATIPTSGLQDVVNYTTTDTVAAGSPLAERGVPKQMLEAYLPASTAKTSVTNSSNSWYRQEALRVAFPMNDVTRYELLPAYDGFPKSIPNFATEAQVFYVPQFIKAGGEAQVHFKGTASELAPYLAEAMKLAVVQTNLKDSRSIYIKMEPNSDMHYAPSLRELLPDYKIVVENTLNNLGPWSELWGPMVTSHTIDTVAGSDVTTSLATGEDSNQLFADSTNRAMQQQVLGYYSYNYHNETLNNADYDYYIFNVGTRYDHPYVTGAAFAKTGTEVIYFYRQL